MRTNEENSFDAKELAEHIFTESAHTQLIMNHEVDCDELIIMARGNYNRPKDFNMRPMGMMGEELTDAEFREFLNEYNELHKSVATEYLNKKQHFTIEYSANETEEMYCSFYEARDAARAKQKSFTLVIDDVDVYSE